MALEDKDLFIAICNRYADHPMDFIMEQYEKAKMMNLQIERRIGQLAAPEMVAEAGAPEAEAEPAEEAPAEAPRKKYTRRDLVVPAATAITDDYVTCCLCGAKRQSLTVTHLATHDISVEEYKRLCRYSPEQKLMSGKRLAKSKEIISRAQQRRLEKIAENKNGMEA